MGAAAGADVGLPQVRGLEGGVSERFIVMFSGGIGSWAAAKRTVAEHGAKNVQLLFCDTLIEDPDLYRFIDEAAADVGAPLIKIADGRTPRQVYRDRRMLGNSRIAPCSTELKQKPARKWVDVWCSEHLGYRPTIVLGVDWTELHRLEGAARGWAPYPVDAPLTRPPLRYKEELLAELEQAGIMRPALYRQGFAHNNCGGGCCRAGLAQWAHLYRTKPETFAEWEATEEDLRAYLNADVSMLRNRRFGANPVLTLREVRQRVEQQQTLFAGEEWGGCGCFMEEAPND